MSDGNVSNNNNKNVKPIFGTIKETVVSKNYCIGFGSGVTICVISALIVFLWRKFKCKAPKK